MRLRDSVRFKRWISCFLLILASILAYVVIANFGMIYGWVAGFFRHLSPFFAGVVLAYLLDIPCSWLERALRWAGNFLSRYARVASVLLTYLLLLLILVATMVIVVPIIGKNITEFAQNFSNYYKNTMDLIRSLNNKELNALGLGSTLQAQLANTLNSVYLKSVNSATDINFIWRSILKVLDFSSYLINLFITVISSIYILLEKESIQAYLLKWVHVLVPARVQAGISKYVYEININFKKFIFFNMVDGVIIGAASILGLQLIGSKFAFVLGIVVGVTTMIPYFGAIIGSIFAAVIILITEGVDKALLAGLFLFILHQIDGNILKPKLFGESFHMSPLLVILSITLGGMYFGVIGMVIAIPIAAVLKNILNDLLTYWLAKKDGNA